MKKTLLILDVQEIMFDHDGGVHKKDQILNNIKSLLTTARVKGIPVVIKHYWDSFMETELQDVLDRIGTEQLIICGMQTDFCVDTTTRSAFSRGYRHNIFVKDGHSTWSDQYVSAENIINHHNQIICGRFAEGMTAEEIIEMTH